MTLVVLLGVFSENDDDNSNNRLQQQQQQEQTDCQRAIEILTIDNVQYEIVIGTDPTEKDATQLLFQLAGPTNQKYPQFFFEEEVITNSQQQQDNNPNQQQQQRQRRTSLSCNNNIVGGDVVYLGDIQFLESMHTCGTIPGTGLGKQNDRIIPRLLDDLDSTCHSYITIESTDSDYEKWSSVSKTNQSKENESIPTSMTIIVENIVVGGTADFPSKHVKLNINPTPILESSSEYAIDDCRKTSNICSSVLLPRTLHTSTTENSHLSDKSENKVSSPPTADFSEGIGKIVKTSKSSTKKKNIVQKEKSRTANTGTTKYKVDNDHNRTKPSLSPSSPEIALEIPSQSDIISEKTPQSSPTKTKKEKLNVTKDSKTKTECSSTRTSPKKSPKKNVTNVSIATLTKTPKLLLNKPSITVELESCFDFENFNKSPIATHTATAASLCTSKIRLPVSTNNNIVYRHDDDDDDDISNSSSTVEDDTDIVSWTTKSGNIRSSPIKRNNSKSLIIRHNSTCSNSANTSITSCSSSSSKNYNIQHIQQQQQQMKHIPLLVDTHNGVSNDGNSCNKTIENDSCAVLQVDDISSSAATTDIMTKRSNVNKQRFHRPCIMRGNSITSIIQDKYDTYANDNNSSISSIAGETMLSSEIFMSFQTPKVTNRKSLRPGMIRGNSFRNQSIDENVTNDPSTTPAVKVIEMSSNDEIVVTHHSNHNIKHGQCDENKCRHLAQFDDDDDVSTALDLTSNNNSTITVEHCDNNTVNSCCSNGITTTVFKASSSLSDSMSLKTPKGTNGKNLRPGMIRGNSFINHLIIDENIPNNQNPTTTTTTTTITINTETTISNDKILGVNHNSKNNIDHKQYNKNICNDLEHDNDNASVVIDVVDPTIYTSTLKIVSPMRQQLRPGMIRGNSLERI